MIIHDAIMGLDPGYDHLEWLENQKLGWWRGGFVDRWDWNRTAVEQLDEQAALAIYNRLKGIA